MGLVSWSDITAIGPWYLYTDLLRRRRDSHVHIITEIWCW